MNDASHPVPDGVAGTHTADAAAGLDANEPGEPISRLRGAKVQVDARRAGQVAVGLVVLTLGVLAVVFFVVGVDKNRQTDELRTQGVPVTFTVSSCQGLLGGSGSNAAGYACRGSYRLRGRVYSEALPGNAFFAPGSTVKAIAVPVDPALVAPVRMVEQEHSSGNVFILPAVLLVILVAIVSALTVRWRRRSAAGGALR